MSTTEKDSLSVIVPAFNEEQVLQAFHDRTVKVLEGIGMEWEIVYVNDGSSDRTLNLIKSFKDTRVTIVDLSRNFGKEIAMTAGIDHARGDAVIVIDADLQDPPELIPELVNKWREGFDVVFARRVTRAGETMLKKVTATFFYRIIRTVSDVPIPENVGDFRLLSRVAVDALQGVRERHRFMKGLFAWIGFRQAAVCYCRDQRYAGKTKWSYWQLWNFAIEGITSFSIGPLKLATYMGLITAMMSFIYAGIVIFKALRYGDPVPGYPSMMTIILFLGGVQLMCLGMIGEYLGRMFNETKRRPLYLLKELTASCMYRRGKIFPSQDIES